MLVQGLDQVPTLGIPQSNRAIAGSGDKMTTIGGYFGFQGVRSERMSPEFDNGLERVGILGIPHEHVPVIADRHHDPTILRDVHRLYGTLPVSRRFSPGAEIVHASRRPQIPNLHVPVPVPADDLRLVRMQADARDRSPRVEGRGKGRASEIPDLDGSVFAAAVHPSSVGLESQAGYVGSMALASQDGVGVGGVVDVVQSYIGVATRREELLVWGHLQVVDLAAAEGEGTGAHPGRGFPESYLVVVAPSR